MGDTVTGTVTNGTTGKPAAGVTVTLVDPMGGMAEVATAKCDAKGQFTVDAPAARGPRLVRAERSGVNYFKMITPGTSSVELSVYDAASSVQGIKGSADVVRMQTQGSTLQAVEMFAVSNDSTPPRTLAAPVTFDFALPDGATIDEAHAQAPNGQPISVQTKPTGQKDHYAFSFALKPGESRLEVAYHLPYNGQASFTPQLSRPFEHFVVLVPSSMSFTPKDPKQFQAMTNQPGSNVQVSLQAQAGSDLSYSIAGNGVFPEETDSQDASAAPAPSANGRTATSGPGGGLGRPEDGPDGLAKYRWYILAALVAVLVGGGIWTRERTLQEAPELAAATSVATAGVTPVASAAAAANSAAPSNLLLTALKEEIFALEVEHQQGKLSQAEYDKARAALEQTLQRALSRAKS
ncbi:MAG: carboxypeptidase regulatory-like domain-containing protein [Candidatus Korobacteraceae bacterium]